MQNCDFTVIVVCAFLGVITTPALILWGCISAWGYMSDEPQFWQTEAVQAGVAEFVIIDQATGETDFKWKECDCDE